MFVPKSVYCLFGAGKLQIFCWSFSRITVLVGPELRVFPEHGISSAKPETALERLDWLVTLSFRHSMGCRLCLKTWKQRIAQCHFFLPEALLVTFQCLQVLVGVCCCFCLFVVVFCSQFIAYSCHLWESWSTRRFLSLYRKQMSFQSLLPDILQTLFHLFFSARSGSPLCISIPFSFFPELPSSLQSHACASPGCSLKSLPRAGGSVWIID